MLVERAGDEGQAGTLGRGPFRDAGPDAPAGAGHERAASVQSSCHGPETRTGQSSVNTLVANAMPIAPIAAAMATATHASAVGRSSSK